MAPRLVRRRPLAERIQAYLSPLDILLWFSEELDSSDLDQWKKECATCCAQFMNSPMVPFTFTEIDLDYSPSKTSGVRWQRRVYSTAFGCA